MRAPTPVARSGAARAALLVAFAAIVPAPSAPVPAQSFIEFESAPVRPIALSPARDLVFAVNTPDNRLEVFAVTSDGLAPAGDCVVGLEPVAVQARAQDEVWVVNHLSDSVSIVDVSDPLAPYVEATLLTGDEPRDVVFAGADAGGPTKRWAFVTAAHRGQNRPGDPELTVPGVGRADVWVFDTSDPSRPPHVITLFADTPRALAASPDGRRVYAAAFASGNRTAALHDLAVSADPELNELIADGFTGLGPPPLPEGLEDTTGVLPPETAIIVAQDGDGAWRDAAGRDWTPRMRFDLPDRDVFAIDASLDPPALIDAASGAGTILFNLAVHPVTGRVWVTNQDARNRVPFEPQVRGHVADTRVSIVDFAAADPAGRVSAIDLNAHIDRGAPSGSEDELARSIAFPLGMEFTADGETLYVAAYGSYKVAVLDASGAVIDRIAAGGGPAGLALDEERGRLYVLNRWDRTISIVDTASRSQTRAVPLGHDPEPPAVREGRPYFYDAARSSAHGDASCATCHIFGDMDGLAWDLGDPGGEVAPNPTAPRGASLLAPLRRFHPMKGPMTTQSLRGLAGAGALHWRGDRNGAGSGAPALDTRASFGAFRSAFQSLLGRATELPAENMDKLAGFVLALRYPPNPIAELDGTLTPAQAEGRRIFTSDGDPNGLGGDGISCSSSSCHALPLGTTGGGINQPGSSQDFKVPHLRNLYAKVGAFGSALPRIVRSPLELESTPTPHLGEQVRGFGFRHDGAIGTIFAFLREEARLRVRVPILPQLQVGDAFEPFQFLDRDDQSGDDRARALEAFLLAFDTGLRPAVGQQVTVSARSGAGERARLELFLGLAKSNLVLQRLDLVAHGLAGGARRGYVFTRGLGFQSDRRRELVAEADLVAATSADAILTFTLLYRGAGVRVGIDRDEDGVFDGDEIDAGTDPGDPTSVPPLPAPGGLVAAVDGDSVEIAWGAVDLPYLDVTGYYVYRSESEPEAGVVITGDPVTEPPYRDAGLSPGTYWYRVATIAGDLASELSVAVRAQVAAIEASFVRADCNTDGEVDVSDAIATLAALFVGGNGFACADACDSNDDGGVDISDAIATLGALFLGQGVIPLPGVEGCRTDPTQDGAECESAPERCGE